MQFCFDKEARNEQEDIKTQECFQDPLKFHQDPLRYGLSVVCESEKRFVLINGKKFEVGACRAKPKVDFHRLGDNSEGCFEPNEQGLKTN